MLRHYGIETRGKKAVVIGRSLVIGKPVTLLLITENATVTVCHTKTTDIKAECRAADIIVACCGVARMVTASGSSDSAGPSNRVGIPLRRRSNAAAGIE